MSEVFKPSTQTVAEQLAINQRAAENFFAAEAKPEQTLKTAQEVMDRMHDLGWTSLVAIPGANRVIRRGDIHPGMKVMLPNWVYVETERKGGNLSTEVMRLSGGIHIFDTTPQVAPGETHDHPESYKQQLADHRSSGDISIPSWTAHLDPTSAFGISALEHEDVVLPTLVAQANLQDQVSAGKAIFRSPKALEAIVYHQLLKTNFGEEPSLEWYADHFGQRGRLLGGDSDRGGLGLVGLSGAGPHDGGIAGRVHIEIPPQA